MGKTKIQWADAVWNPITGCTKVSDGCKHCYAERMASRLGGRAGYPKNNPFAVTLHADKLDEPLRWRESRMIFVCSMGDLFHEDVKDGWIDEVFQVMKEARQHTFLILTKRVRRMFEYVFGPKVTINLPNVWLGTSVENQKTADLRIQILLQIPAAKRFISCEPLLGPVDLYAAVYKTLRGSYYRIAPKFSWGKNKGIDWVICGGESGPGARLMNAAWAKGLRDQCQEAKVPFFFKQWGEWIPSREIDETMAKQVDWKMTNQWESEDDTDIYWQVGKQLAGRKMDGLVWDEIPGESGV